MSFKGPYDGRRWQRRTKKHSSKNKYRIWIWLIIAKIDPLKHSLIGSTRLDWDTHTLNLYFIIFLIFSVSVMLYSIKNVVTILFLLLSLQQWGAVFIVCTVFFLTYNLNKSYSIIA